MKVTHACFDGFWLGLLDPDELHAIDERYYLDEAMYRDPTFNQSGFQPWERAAVDRYFRGCRRLAVIGAGGGREVVALEGEGFEVVGYECNPHLAAEGNALLASLGLTSRIAPMPRDSWSPGGDGFDGVVVGWATYMLIDGRDARIELLRTVRSCLPAGAPVLLSFFVRSGDARYFRIVRAVANAVRRLRRRPPVELGVTIRPNRVQYLSLDEVARELEEGGFAPEHLDDRDYGNAVGLAAVEGGVRTAHRERGR